MLDSRSGGPLRVRIDPVDDLHVELPPAVDLADPDLAAATHAAIDAARRAASAAAAVDASSDSVAGDERR